MFIYTFNDSPLPGVDGVKVKEVETTKTLHELLVEHLCEQTALGNNLILGEATVVRPGVLVADCVQARRDGVYTIAIASERLSVNDQHEVLSYFGSWDFSGKNE